MTRRHDRTRDTPISAEEEVSLLSREERLGKSTVDEADQFDEHDPLNIDAINEERTEERLLSRKIRRK